MSNKQPVKVLTLECYADNFVAQRDPNLNTLLDKDNVGWFTVPEPWAEKMALNDGFASLDAFLDEYICDTVEGWVSRAAAEQVLFGFGWGGYVDETGYNCEPHRYIADL